jgi:GNAT superfamily N-acetyltransferase
MHQEQVKFEVYPAESHCWLDVEKVFGEHGAYAGCWCMFWRLNRADFKQLKGDGTRTVLHEMTVKGDVPGLLLYDQGEPVGWCSVGPRENYLALENSRILKRVDDQPVWSIVCFFVTRPYRGKGAMLALLRGAVDYACQRGAKIVEGYPIDMQSPKLAGQKLSSYSGYMGIASVFRDVGFVEVGRASETQRFMRYRID